MVRCASNAPARCKTHEQPQPTQAINAEKQAMTYTAHVTERLTSARAATQALFCLSVSERLLVCAWCFEQVSGHKMQELAPIADRLFATASGTATCSRRTLHSLIKRLDALIPQSDDYGDALATQAQTAGIASLAAALLLVGEPTGRDCVTTASFAVDAVLCYTSALSEAFGMASEESEGHLLERELGRQAADIRFLTSSMADDALSLSLWRMRNRQFSIPPALSIGRVSP
jgi:hypothetical protein